MSPILIKRTGQPPLLKVRFTSGGARAPEGEGVKDAQKKTKARGGKKKVSKRAKTTLIYFGGKKGLLYESMVASVVGSHISIFV